MSVCGIVAQEFDPKDYTKNVFAFLGRRGQRKLTELFQSLVDDGVDEFIISMDGGYALFLAMTLLAWRMDADMDLKINCMILWEEQAAHWPERIRTFFFFVMEFCDREIMLEHHRSDGNLDRRDRRLLKDCQQLLAIWDGTPGPVWKTVTLARQMGLKVRELPLKD